MSNLFIIICFVLILITGLAAFVLSLVGWESKLGRAVFFFWIIFMPIATITALLYLSVPTIKQSNTQPLSDVEALAMESLHVEERQAKTKQSHGDGAEVQTDTAKRQRFVPEEGMEDESHWTVLPKGSELHPEGWAVMAWLPLGGKARLKHPNDETTFLEIELIDGDADWVQLDIKDLVLNNRVRITVKRDENASIFVDGKGYTVRFPTQHAGPNEPDTTHLATILVMEAEDSPNL